MIVSSMKILPGYARRIHCLNTLGDRFVAACDDTIRVWNSVTGGFEFLRPQGKSILSDAVVVELVFEARQS